MISSHLGLGIEGLGRLLKVARQTVTSLVLLGTPKNTGFVAGLALTLSTKKTAVPATISTIFMLVYIIWLSFRQRPSQFFTAESAEKNH